MSRRLGVGRIAAIAALLECGKGPPRTEAGPEPVAKAVPSGPSTPLPPVKGIVDGKPFEVKAALALHRWRGGKKNVELYDVPKTCAETRASGARANASVIRAVNMVVRWKTGEHISVEGRGRGPGGFNTYGPGTLTSIAPFDALDVTVIDAGSASAPGRIRFRAVGAASTIAGDVEVTLCPPSGGPPTECVTDEECADGSFCRRDTSRDRAKKTAKGMMGTFGALGRCVPSSPAP